MAEHYTWGCLLSYDLFIVGAGVADDKSVMYEEDEEQ